MKKLIALVLVFCMALAIACSTKPATTEQPANEPAKEEKTVLKLWCIATESDANRPAYEKAIAEFEAAHSDIKIEWEAFENESYKTTIPTPCPTSSSPGPARSSAISSMQAT